MFQGRLTLMILITLLGAGAMIAQDALRWFAEDRLGDDRAQIFLESISNVLDRHCTEALRHQKLGSVALEIEFSAQSLAALEVGKKTPGNYSIKKIYAEPSPEPHQWNLHMTLSKGDRDLTKSFPIYAVTGKSGQILACASSDTELPASVATVAMSALICESLIGDKKDLCIAASP